MSSFCGELFTSQIACDKGSLFLEGPVTAGYLSSLDFDESLSNFRKANKQKTCLCEIADSDDGLLYIARFENNVTGYITFHHPDQYTRWYIHP
ncbi:MAG: N-acetyltransferase, partial [Desulfocucumaceae bacterium]